MLGMVALDACKYLVPTEYTSIFRLKVWRSSMAERAGHFRQYCLISQGVYNRLSVERHSKVNCIVAFCFDVAILCRDVCNLHFDPQP